MNLLRIRLVRHTSRRRWSPGVLPAIDPTAELHHGGIGVTLPGVPWSLLVTRAGAESVRIGRWRPFATHRLVTARARTANRWMDLRASLAGYCNDTPYEPVPGQGGGYVHWRCALDAGHPGLHRARNYVWDAEGHTEYLPLPTTAAGVDQPWERHHVLTRRQAQAKKAWIRRRARQHRTEQVPEP